MLFSFGIIADVQHANIDDGHNFHRTRTRYYRHALLKFEQAIDTWNEYDVDFSVQLGDVIDGFSAKYGERDNDTRNIVEVIKKFKATGLSVAKHGNVYMSCDDNSIKTPYMCHIWGNHEFYNYKRSDLWRSELNSYVSSVGEDSTTKKTSDWTDDVNPVQINAFDWTDEEVNKSRGYYYSFLHKGFRFIVLDTYDIGKISRPLGSEVHNTALKWLAASKEKNNRTNVPDDPTVSWNGALSKEQLNWLRDELVYAKDNDQKVIIFSHIPLHAQASRKASLCWNYEEILSVINSYNTCVVACFAGHFHDGGFYYDTENHVYYLTFSGVIERDPGTNAYATVQVYGDHIEMIGYGEIESRILKFQ